MAGVGGVGAAGIDAAPVTAVIERFRCVGIEINEEYAALAESRAKKVQVNLF